MVIKVSIPNKMNKQKHKEYDILVRANFLLQKLKRMKILKPRHMSMKIEFYNVNFRKKFNFCY